MADADRPRPEEAVPGEPDPNELTNLLLAWSDGDRVARDQMIPLVVEELRKMARGFLARERQGHTLQPTALVNEVYLKLIDLDRVGWSTRAQFFAFAAELMRRVLVDHARQQRAKKRGGGQVRTSITAALGVAKEKNVDIVALDQALFDLARFDAQGSRIVEMRYFGGLTIEEVAEVMQLGTTTVKRKWRHATTWLFRQLEAEAGP